MKRLDASPATLFVLGLFAAIKGLALVVLAEAVATGVVSVIAGTEQWRDAAALAVLAGVGRAAASWATQVFAQRAALTAKSQVRASLTDRMLAGATGRTGSTAALASVGLDELDNYYRTVLPAMLTTATVPLIVGLRILSVDWLSALIVVITVPLVPVFLALVGLHTQDRAQAASATLDRLSDHLVELARGLPVLVGLGRVADQSVALHRISENHRATTMNTLRSAFLSSLVLELISTISVAIVAVSVGIRLVNGDMPLVIGLVALILAPECFAPFRDLGAAFHSSNDGLVARQRARALIEAPVSESIVIAEGNPAVADLTVAFEGRGAVVHGVSFSLAPGQITSIEGPSGSGKSTVLAALAGLLYDATVTGHITGIDRARVAWVPQHPHTVGDTVRTELELYAGAADAAIDGILAVLGLTALADVDPAQLSPGELRRLAVARGLLRVADGATLLLLDEPTAHLDPASAQLVSAELLKLRGRVTIVMASHEAAISELANHRVFLGISGGLRAARWSHDDRASDRETPAPTEPATDGEPASALSTLLAYLRPTGWRFVASALLGTGASLFAISLTAVSAWLIVRAAEQPPIMYLLVAIVGVRFFGLGRSGLRYAERLLTHDAVLGSLTHLRMRLWNGLAAKGVTSRSLARGGVALDYLVASADRVRDLVPRVLLPIVVGVLSSVAVVTTVALLHAPALPTVIGLLAVALLVAPAVALLADRSAARGQALVRSTVVRRVTAVLSAATELRANGVSDAARASVARLDAAAAVQARRSAGALGLGGAIVLFACCATAGAMLYVSAGAGVQPGIVAVLVLLPIALAEPLLGLIDAVQQAPALTFALRRVGAVASSQPIAEPARRDEVHSLELRELSAGWPGAAPAFRDVSARAFRGDWIVVEGPSGSGKSTLLATLLGYLAPASGDILVNGKHHDGLRASIAWCPQEAHIFDSTIRANLLLARSRDDRPDDAALVAALHRVGLGPLLETLPLGLDTRLGAEGSKLSGGQRQRLAVARTLLARSDIVLLDEPTAHLDAAAARSLMADLRSALADHIVVLVTHHADEVLPCDERVRLGALPELQRV
ncbi:MAG: thiol reductant ABC exporter subunit CydC [Microbacteriaceae bacterium]